MPTSIDRVGAAATAPVGVSATYCGASMFVPAVLRNPFRGPTPRSGSQRRHSNSRRTCSGESIRPAHSARAPRRCMPSSNVLLSSFCLLVCHFRCETFFLYRYSQSIYQEGAFSNISFNLSVCPMRIAVGASGAPGWRVRTVRAVGEGPTIPFPEIRIGVLKATSGQQRS